jgi:cellulose synthase/poly-beta-1,6-N-acetylglucosamine synthase-like glycosyltransferase
MILETCFWLAAAVVLYCYLGYPALLALRGWLRPAPPVHRDEATPSVSMIIVAHNEEDRIEKKLGNCRDLDYPEDRLEILVASDGSTDRTENIVAKHATRGVRLLPLPGPRGKAAALNAAVPEARGEVLVFCDVRQDLDPQAVRVLVANLADPWVGAVSGELHLEPASGSAGMEGVGLYWRYEKWIRRAESRVDSIVGVTGAIYALRRALYRPLDPRTILDDVAIPMAVVGAGYRVVFEPLAKAYDRLAEDPRAEYRRKVRTLAGNYQLAALYPSLLHPGRNRLFWQFASHKLLRLAVPWCLLALLATSAALAARRSAFFTTVLVLQMTLYVLAFAGWLLKGFGLGSRLLSVPYTFVLLNVAAAASLFGFLSGRTTAAWRRSGR